jgi:aminoacrylate hydrolase
MSKAPPDSRTHTVALPDGANLNVLDDGEGTALFLISGLGGTANFWNPCIPIFSSHYRTLRLDQRGIGKSSRGTASCTIDQLAADCLAVMDHCNIDSAILVGHSTGGCIAQAISLSAPERVRACVLSATWAKPSRYCDELFSARQEMLFKDPMGYACSSVFMGYDAHWLNNHWNVLENAKANAPLSPKSQRIVAERIQALMAFDRSRDIPQIKIPKLVLGARDDLIVPAFLQEELTKLLTNVHSHLFENGGHFFPVTRSSLFTQFVIDWLFSVQNEA